jgi:hypothetical protein
MVHSLKMPSHILGRNRFMASKSQCELAVEIGTHGPGRTFDRIIPTSKMVVETLLATAFKVTEQNIQRLPPFMNKYLTNLGRGLLDI